MSAAHALSEVAAATAAAGRRPIALDLTRLLARGLHEAPTGIDRVELAYARHLIGAIDRPVSFEAWVPGLGFTCFATPAAAWLLAAIERRWDEGRGLRTVEVVRAATGFRPARRLARGAVHLIVSHQHLADFKRRVRKGDDTRTCVYVHDTIPSDYPEYARPGGAALHDRRMRNAVGLADGLIVNSRATARSLERFMLEMGRRPKLLVAPLGVETMFMPERSPAPFADERPYFLCVGTIEPRKNHLLLLHLWRALAAGAPASTLPRLVLVGRRGWENENIVDLLDRCPALADLVVEMGQVGDAQLRPLLSHARAVLMPSFAEGFGLPVAEALAAGVPVIASDIGVLRETGGDAPDYVDPLDGAGWMQAITDHARDESPMREAQLQRIKAWTPPRWDAHFETVLPFLDAL